MTDLERTMKLPDNLWDVLTLEETVETMVDTWKRGWGVLTIVKDGRPTALLGMRRPEEDLAEGR